jgi:transposase-like protein
MTRRKFSLEFKIETVRLVADFSYIRISRRSGGVVTLTGLTLLVH